MVIKGSKEAQKIISQGYFFCCNEGSKIFRIFENSFSVLYNSLRRVNDVGEA
ncbi:MAG: hypothetical protein IJ192_08925 [Clostridia bacterium]|nr:hypothetical protein [Clostridia bacterium]